MGGVCIAYVLKRSQNIVKCQRHLHLEREKKERVVIQKVDDPAKGTKTLVLDNPPSYHVM